MRIAVCMKAVVEPEARIELDSAGALQRSDLRYELNEYDLYAVEEAIRANEAHDAEVTVVSLGTGEVVQSLRKGLAMGATNGRVFTIWISYRFNTILPGAGWVRPMR